MAELQKLLQANGTFKSELMQAFLSAAQQSFREHSKSGGSHSSSSAVPSTSSTAMPPDVNLNVSPSMLGSQNFSGSSDVINVSSPSSIQAPSPFPDLGMAELSPLTSGVNLNIGQVFDNKAFMGQSGNLNGNSVYSPSSQSVNDNMPSPLIMPLDNIDTSSPSSYMAFSSNQLASPDSLASPNNLNNNNTTAPTGFSTANIMDNKGNINMNLMSPSTSLLSPGSIKQEADTLLIKQEPLEASFEPFETNANNEAEVARIMAEVKETPSQTRRLLIDQVTDAIIEAHMATTINTYANVAEANERIAKMKAQHEMPDISKLSLSASSLWQQFLSSMVPEITKVVKFCKKLPGFSEVEQEDQIRLIKQGSFEVMLARFSILVDDVNEEMLDPSLNMKSPRHVIRDMPMGVFLDEFFHVAKQFNPLRLTDGEIGLFTAILMICPDRDGLKNIAAIHTIQQLFLQALYFLMQHNHKDPDHIFRSLIGMVPIFRKINQDHAKYLNNIKMKSPTEFDKEFPPLHKEIFETSS